MTSWLLLKNEQEGRGEAVAIKGLEAASNLPESDVDRLVVAKAVFNGDSSGDAAKSLARGGGVALRLLARQYRNVWEAAPLKKLSVETLTPLSGSYDGDSADLLYALVTFLSLAQDSDLIQALQRDFAATGTLDSKGVVGPVNAVVLKVEAAIQKLPRGSIVFYPHHRPEGETRWVDETLIVRARDRGIELQAVEFIEEALAALGIEVLGPRRDQSPYRALSTYQVEHSHIFFGRDDQVTEFLDRLQQAAEAKRPGGLVEAASGAGKSSFVQAGLLARLRILPRKAHTPVEYAVWQPRLAGASQATEIDEGVLAKSVLLNWKTHAGVNSTGFSGLNDLEDIHKLEDLGARLGKTALDDRILVWVVDQFEELFTQRYTDAARVAFARFLAQLQAMGVWVIGTLRTEFKSRFMALADEQGKPLLVDVFKNLMFPLARMPVEALGQMITEPARVAGVSFETRADGVRLDALLRQDALGADSMPLVGYALNELWLKKKLPDKPDQLGRKTPQLTFEAYKAICGGEERGGIRRVLGIEAERAFETLPQEARDELPRLLDALAVPLEGEEKETARPADLAQWEEGTPGWHLVEALREKRLLITEPATETTPAQVRVVHEALFEEWVKARKHLVNSRETRVQIKRLTAKCVEWSSRSGPMLTSAGDLESAAQLRPELARRPGLQYVLDFVNLSLQRSQEAQEQALREVTVQLRARMASAIEPIVQLPSTVFQDHQLWFPKLHRVDVDTSTDSVDSARAQTVLNVAVVTAEAGWGKSALARYIALSALENRPRHFIPEMLERLVRKANFALYLDLSVRPPPSVLWSESAQEFLQFHLQRLGLLVGEIATLIGLLSNRECAIILDAVEDLTLWVNDTQSDGASSPAHFFAQVLSELYAIAPLARIVIFSRPAALSIVKESLDAARRDTGFFNFRRLTRWDIERIAATGYLTADSGVIDQVAATAVTPGLADIISPLLVGPLLRYGAVNGATGKSSVSILMNLARRMLSDAESNFGVDVLSALAWIADASLSERTLELLLPEFPEAIPNLPPEVEDPGLTPALGELAAERTILSRSEDGYIQFAHARYRDFFAARHAAAYSNHSEIAALALDANTSQIGVWAVALSVAEKAESAIAELFNDVNSVCIIARCLGERRGARFRSDRLVRLISNHLTRAPLSARIELLQTLLAYPSLGLGADSMKCLNAFVVLDSMETEVALNDTSGFVQASLEESASIHVERFGSCNTFALYLTGDRKGVIECFFSPSSSKAIPGISWRAGSLSIQTRGPAAFDLSPFHAVPEIAALKWISELVQGLQLGEIRAATDVCRVHGGDHGWKLLCAALQLEVLAQLSFGHDGELDDEIELTFESVLKVLNSVPPSFAPAFAIGMCNALYCHLDGNRLEIWREEILAKRSVAVSAQIEIVIRAESRINAGRVVEDQIDDAVLRSVLTSRINDLTTEPLIRGSSEKPSPLLRRTISTHGSIVHKLKAKETGGRQAYYFVLVPPSLEAAFMSAIDGDGNIDLEDFGLVVASNFGESPSEEVKGFLSKDYGFDL
jgi:hypothetical protein